MNATVKSTVHILKNVHGWVLTYIVRGESVTLRKTFKRLAAGEVEMTRQEAREHYQCQLRNGFLAPDATF